MFRVCLGHGYYIRSGLGRSSWSTTNSFDGDLGRGTGSQRERVVFRVFFLGNSAVESHCARDGSVIGRVSVADASLSLSLSLWPWLRRRARFQCRGSASRLTGQQRRLGQFCPQGHSCARRVVRGTLSHPCATRARDGLSCSPTRGMLGRLAAGVPAYPGTLLGASSLGVQEPARLSARHIVGDWQ